MNVTSNTINPKVQKRFGFPENSVELFAERVETLSGKGLRNNCLSVFPRMYIYIYIYIFFIYLFIYLFIYPHTQVCI